MYVVQSLSPYVRKNITYAGCYGLKSFFGFLLNQNLYITSSELTVLPPGTDISHIRLHRQTDGHMPVPFQ